MATLIASLTALRSEINSCFPGRSKTSDGWIGDAAHAERDSDHNPDSRGLVHAIDVDKDLGGADMQTLVDTVLARCRSGAEHRLTYIIFRRRIYSASVKWAGRAYSGANQHTEHAHFSGSSVPAREQDKSSWHIQEVPVALTAADKTWIGKEIRTAIEQEFARTEQPNKGGITSRVGRDALDQGVPNPLAGGGKTTVWQLLEDIAQALKDAQQPVGK